MSLNLNNLIETLQTLASNSDDNSNAIDLLNIVKAIQFSNAGQIVEYADQAAFPSATISIKQFALDLSTNAIYYSNGETWNQITTAVVNNLTTSSANTAVTVSVAADLNAQIDQLANNIDNSLGGLIYSTGQNNEGQLGLGSTTNKNVFTQTPTEFAVDKIFTGRNNTYATAKNGTLWGWGLNWAGGLGLGDTDNRSIPVQITGTDHWKKATGGYSYSMLLKTNGTLLSAGNNYAGQLGYAISNTPGAFVSQISSPIQIGALTNWAKLSVGKYFEEGVLAIKTNGSLWGWGTNANGQLGLGDNLTRSSPVQIGALTDWSQASTSDQHAVAVKTDGTLWSWGVNFRGQLGQGNTSNQVSPTQVGALTNWSNAAAGNLFTMAIKTDGTLWSCGYNNFGQLGQGDTSNRSSPTQVGVLTNWSTISLSKNSVLATKTDGTLWGWGWNQYGELGLGNIGACSSPVQVGSLTDWAKVFVNEFYPSQDPVAVSAAIKTDGTLWLWGDQNPIIQSMIPVQYGTDINWSQVTIGRQSILALKTDGTLWGAGENQYGQLGLGDAVRRSSLVQVGGDGWTDISMYGVWYEGSTDRTSGTVGIKTDGTLWGWGKGNILFDVEGAILEQHNFSEVPASTPWEDIICGYAYNLALATDGTMWTWGENYNGQLGLGNFDDKSSPVQIGSLTTWSKLATTCGYSTAGAILSDGTMWGCGYNRNDMLGQGTGNVPTFLSVPTQITTSTNWRTAVPIGQSNGWVGIKDDGTLWSTRQKLSWRYDNTNNIYVSPSQIGADSNWSEFSSDFTLSYGAIKTDGTLWTWGTNTYGSLGQGDVFNRSSPTQVGSLTDWAKISMSGWGGLALKTDGSLWSWGQRRFRGQLEFANNASPVQVGTDYNWAYIETSQGDEVLNFAIKTNGTLWAWGRNAFGQLGTNDYADRYSPVQIGALTDWKQISTVGVDGIVAVKTDGTLWSWGLNGYGQLGLGDTDRRSSPVQIGALTDWKSVSVGSNGTCAIKTDGTAWIWGNPFSDYSSVAYGNFPSSPIQLGTSADWEEINLENNQATGIKTDRTLWVWGINNLIQSSDVTTLGFQGSNIVKTMSQITDSSDWAELAMNYVALAAIKTNGTLWTCGGNGFGELGIGTLTPSSVNSPVQVGAAADWQKVWGSGYTTFIARKIDGTYWGWGNNIDGQLGLGDNDNRSIPTYLPNSEVWKDFACGYYHNVIATPVTPLTPV